jgi:hypothetical protein
MADSFYDRAGQLLSPGDIFDRLPYIRLSKPLKVARKPRVTLPARLKQKITGELREIFEVGKHEPTPSFAFESKGEEILSNARMSKAIFLTWGSEVEHDERSSNLHRKDWLIAPVFPLNPLEGKQITDAHSGKTMDRADVIRAGKSPRYFPLQPLPDQDSHEYYVDFRKILPLAATHFQSLPRSWRLAPRALNDFYSQLLWFFTRKKLFFGPVECSSCGKPVDLGITFEGQPVGPENE